MFHVSPDIDRCEKNNGGCEHWCNDTDTGVICDCDEGFILQVNGKGCQGKTTIKNTILIFHFQ